MKNANFTQRYRSILKSRLILRHYRCHLDNKGIVRALSGSERIHLSGKVPNITLLTVSSYTVTEKLKISTRKEWTAGASKIGRQADYQPLSGRVQGIGLWTPSYGLLLKETRAGLNWLRLNYVGLFTTTLYVRDSNTSFGLRPWSTGQLGDVVSFHMKAEMIGARKRSVAETALERSIAGVLPLVPENVSIIVLVN